MTSTITAHRRAISIAAVVLLLTLSFPATTSAHELKVDGDISAILHTDPDDNPIAGSPVSYIIFFSDSTGRFSLPKCNCTVAITKGGRLVAGNPLTISGNTASENHYTFAEPGTYSLDFTGTPKTPGAFQPFKLDYTVRVGRQAGTQTMPAAVWTLMGIVAALILLTAQVTHSASSKKTRKKHT